MATQTRETILRTLRSKGKCTIKELAGAAGVSPISIRHHLANLQAERFIATEEVRQVVMHALEELKAMEILQLDVRNITPIADIMVICNGRSIRHVKSIADNVILQTKKSGKPIFGVEGENFGEWILIDLGDLIVHVMLPETRAFYELEKMNHDHITISVPEPSHHG